MIVRTPEDARRLFDGGVPIDKLNIGNMHFSKGKTEFSKKVYLDETDAENLDYLKSKNVDVFVQDVPDDRVIKY